jgi:hypothetical protein
MTRVRVAKERLCPARKRGRTSGIKKQVTGQLKHTEKQKGDEEKSRK